MKKGFAAITFMLVFAGVSIAQKGTAENGYWPMGYSGDTWTGEITAVKEDTREFTLTYKKGDKEQTFVGVIAKGFTVKLKDGKDYEVKMDELLGMRAKAYYITKSKKDAAGIVTKTNEVFQLRFLPKDK